FLPFDRCRHRRPWPCPDRVRWRGSLRVPIARRVNENPARALVLPHLEGQLFGIGVDKLGRDVTCEGADLVEVRSLLEWNEHVESTRTGRFDERVEMLPFEQPAKRQRGTADCLKVAA